MHLDFLGPLTRICYCDKSPIKAFVRPHAFYVICFTSIYLLYFGFNSVITNYGYLLFELISISIYHRAFKFIPITI